MPVRREQVAAALKYLGDKADVKRRYERMVSLDQPQDADAIDMALEMGGSLVPGVGPALAARDFERARRADDKAGMAMAGASVLPLGRLVGALKQYDPVMREIDVYHGTPHRFPSTETNPLGEFDASKIGTGEGAQAFGHGIYLAEKPNVAQDYQFSLSKIDPAGATYQGKPVQEWYDKAYAEQNRAHRTGDEAAIDKANAKVAFWENVMTRRHPEDVKRVANDPDDGWPTFAKYANSLDMKKFGGLTETGSLYKADLPDEMVDRMLDYDKTLGEQPNLLKIAKQLKDKYLQWDDPVELGTGKELYEALEAQIGTIKATEVLREVGIPGIRYLDAGSRGQGGTGTRNFVVFPGEEKKVKILKRE